MSRSTSRFAAPPATDAPIATLAAPSAGHPGGTRRTSARSAGSHSRSPRTGSQRGGTGRRLSPMIARWPLELADGFESQRNSDPAIAIVRRCLADYRSGRADTASRAWHDDITWSVRGGPPAGGRWEGAEGVFAYHRLLEELSAGTFRQHLLALEGSRGSLVDAYLRTSATRGGRTLEIPTLAVFELAGGLVRAVTELPGDLQAWEAFWAD